MTEFNLNTNSNSNSQGNINNDQGYFRNCKNNNINQPPLIQLAYLSNIHNNDESDVTIDLNPNYLTWDELCGLFFRSPSGSFWINPTNSSCSFITLSDQTYQSSQNRHIPFCLSDQIIKCWTKKNNLPESALSANYRILLNRENFLIKSLASIKAYSLGLSLDECINSLLANKDIYVCDTNSCATVKFIISYKNYFKPLDTSVLVNFVFISEITGYRNNVTTIKEDNVSIISEQFYNVSPSTIDYTTMCSSNPTLPSSKDCEFSTIYECSEKLSCDNDESSSCDHKNKKLYLEENISLPSSNSSNVFNVANTVISESFTICSSLT